MGASRNDYFTYICKKHYWKFELYMVLYVIVLSNLRLFSVPNVFAHSDWFIFHQNSVAVISISTYFLNSFLDTVEWHRFSFPGKEAYFPAILDSNSHNWMFSCS